MDSDDVIPSARIEFIAVLAMMGLYGITCMQSFLYYVHYQRTDRWFLQFLVAFLWLMDTTHTVITVRGFWVFIIHIQDPLRISQEYFWAGLFNAIVTLTSQLFFVVRIWNLSGKKLLVPIFFVPCTLFQFAGIVAFTVICLRGAPTAEVVDAIERLPMAIWGVQAAEDVLISASLIYLLWSQRVNSGFKSTDRLLYRLTLFGINTGLWTALCALFTIITLAAFPNIEVWTALTFVLCPLYCNTLLANLNARGYIRGDESTRLDGQSRSNLTSIVFSRFRAVRPEASGTDASAISHNAIDDLSSSTVANNPSMRLDKLDSKGALTVV